MQWQSPQLIRPNSRTKVKENGCNIKKEIRNKGKIRDTNV